MAATKAAQSPEKLRKKAKKALAGEAAEALQPLSPAPAEAEGKRPKSKDGKRKRDAPAGAEAAGAAAKATSKETKSKAGDAKKPKKEAQAEKAADAAGSASESEAPSAVSEEEDPRSLDKFALSESIKEALRKKGIRSLFPIQCQTFDIVMAGHDLVARARTGQGKTLAFVLPILERLLKDPGWRDSPKRYGRAPRVIVLAPTRELAKQVGADFEHLGEAVKLQTVCVYGGAPMSAQEGLLRRGVDVVVGTPGRVKDLLARGSLSLKQLSFRVLDEADEMLNMGFVDDVEAILGAVEDASTVQTLLFSATVPTWVNKIAERFFNASRRMVDLVGEDKLKASASVRHLLLPCHWTQRAQVLTDLISCYARGERVIVFTETKNDASALAEGLSHVGARPLHGDIAQSHRETTLAGFRAGSFKVLVATDVAARGLDINNVQLVVQCSPPQTEETYIHRSGRTGRAGNTGVSVMLTGGKKDYMISVIERKAGVKFERISVPQPADIARASAATAAGTVQGVSDSVVALFRGAAEELVASSSLPAMDLLAKALAKISGQSELKRRSLLTAHDDATTLHFQASTTSVRTPTYVFATLRRLLSQDLVDRVRRMTLTADGHGAVFDVPSDVMQQFLDAFAAEADSDARSPVTLQAPDSLPELQSRPEGDRGSRSEGSGFRGRGGGRGRGFGRRGR